MLGIGIFVCDKVSKEYNSLADPHELNLAYLSYSLLLNHKDKYCGIRILSLTLNVV